MGERAELDVHYVAGLARLSLTEEEGRLFQKQLAAVLAHAKKLNELDLAEIAEAGGDAVSEAVPRRDEPDPWFTAEEALRNAPRQADKLFIVPKVLE